MDRFKVALVALIAVLFLCVVPAFADNDDHISTSVYREYFKEKAINYDDTVRYFGEKDAPVAGFFVERSGRNIDEVRSAFARSNNDWFKAALILRIDIPGLFLPVPDNYRVGPPYGHAYGYWKKHRRNPHYRMILSSDDLVNLAFLNIIHARYRTPVTEIMSRRRMGVPFTGIIRTEYDRDLKFRHKNNRPYVTDKHNNKDWKNNNYRQNPYNPYQSNDSKHNGNYNNKEKENGHSDDHGNSHGDSQGNGHGHGQGHGKNK